MKIYTGTGDRGKTSLFSGERVEKSHLRIEICGDIDELNSVLGALAATVRKDREDTIKEIQYIQSCLLQIGAWLSTTPGSPVRSDIQKTTESQIEFLENAIDHMEEALPELKDFILPGGHISAAWAHVARAVCRRAERAAVKLYNETENQDSSDPNSLALIFLNRLSDYLFVKARYCNMVSGISDAPWQP